MNSETEKPVDWPALVWTGVGIAAVAATAVLALAIVHCFFAVPISDDFHFRTNARDQGYAEAMQAYWETASGRLTSLTVILFIYRLTDFLSPGHALALVCFVLMTVAACGVYAAVVFRTRLTDPRAPVVGLLLFALYWGVMPLPGETFAWLPEAAQAPPAFLFFALLLFALQPSREFGDGARWFAVSLLALVFSMLHEWLTLLGGFALTLLAIAAFARRSPTARFHLAALPLMAAGLAVTTLAPGVRTRVNRLEGGGASFDTLREVYVRFQSDIGDWVGNFAFVAFVALLLMLASWFRPGAEAARSRRPRHALLLALGLLVGVFLGLLAYRIGTGGTLPWMARVLNVLCLGLLWGAAAIAAELPLSRRRARPAAILVMGTLYAAAVLTSPNVRTAVSDLRSGATQQYRRDYEALHQRLLRADESEAVVLEAYPEAPRLFPPNIVSSHPSFWINRRMAEYYGLESLVYTEGPRLGVKGRKLEE